MSTSQTIARLLKQRESWCTLRPAEGESPELAVCLRRPPEVDLKALTTDDGRVRRDALSAMVSSAAVNWKGFTEAELLGAAIGSSDPLEFDHALWIEVVRDRAEWQAACEAHLVARINEHLEARAAQRKN